MHYKHLKTGGIYRLQMLATNEADLQTVVIYSNIHSGEIWVRPAAEFFDGRFERHFGDMSDTAPQRMQ